MSIYDQLPELQPEYYWTVYYNTSTNTYVVRVRQHVNWWYRVRGHGPEMLRVEGWRNTAVNKAAEVAEDMGYVK